MSSSDAPSTVVLPAGPPLLEAAAWVGRACWVELRIHELITGWLAEPLDPHEALSLWSVRSASAEAAEAWHRRLPELREFPRSEFVAPARPDLPGVLTEAAAVPADRRVSVLVTLLTSVAEGYRAHLDVAVGPADGPVRRTLVREIARVDDDRARLGVGADAGWAGRLAGSGVL